MLDLDFTEEQDLLRRTARGVLAEHCPLSVVRAMEDDPVGIPVSLWQQLGDLDLVGLLLPERYGGSGMSLVEGVALYEELGRSLAPVPHFSSAVICGGLLAASGTPEQQERWLPGIASGAVVAAPACLESGGGFRPEGIDTRVVADGRTDSGSGGLRLSGTKRHVPFAAAADVLVVVARGTAGVELYLVDPKADGVTLTQQHTIASDTQYDVSFDSVRVEDADRIGPAGGGWSVWEEVLHPSYILLAAQAIGAARYALDITVQYAKDREQFDKPLGAFQAIAHYLSDAVTAVDGAEQLVHEAAWAASTGRPISALAPESKLFACKVFRDVTAMAQQVFGGIGFTVEFDIQLYFRRAKAWQLSWSDDRVLEELVATSVLD